jgi:hypothetical protein
MNDIHFWLLQETGKNDPNLKTDQAGNIKYQDYYHKKLRGYSSQANYTDRATAACRRS